MNLICVCHATHAACNTEDIVVESEDPKLARGSVGFTIDGKLESSVINTREVARSRWLVFNGVKSEGIDVDTSLGNTGEVLVGLDEIEVITVAGIKAVVTVELELSILDGVKTIVAEGIVGVVVESLTIVLVIEITNEPSEELNGVVEVKLGFNGLVLTTIDGFSTSELELFNEVFVGGLCETTTLISIEENVVDPERALLHRKVGSSTSGYETRLGTEFNVETNFVVLESNEGKSNTSMSVEPEDEGNVVSTGSTSSDSSFVIVVGFTDHLVITSSLFGSLGKLIPDIEPFTVVLVNTLTTDFDFNRFNEEVAETIANGDSSIAGVSKSDLEVSTVDKITVTGYRACNTIAKIGITIDVNTLIFL